MVTKNANWIYIINLKTPEHLWSYHLYRGPREMRQAEDHSCSMHCPTSELKPCFHTGPYIYWLINLKMIILTYNNNNFTIILLYSKDKEKKKEKGLSTKKPTRKMINKISWLKAFFFHFSFFSWSLS